MNDVFAAFLLGTISASSLGLGAATARIWKPTNFVLGLLTAFGAGALLSAVTIDIVAPSVEDGQFVWLAVGAVAGGLAFEGLNRAINARGGFLRKASTTITFLRDREHRRVLEILDDLERIDIFDGLPDRELDTIARAFRPERLDAHESLYRHGDPCDHINVLAEGEISLSTPEGTEQLRPHQAFGHLAFVSGTRHRSTATATRDSEVLRLSRSRLRSVLTDCPVFSERLRSRIGSADLAAYLRRFHPEIAEGDVAAWAETVEREGVHLLPQLAAVAAVAPTEMVIDHLADVEPFRGMPDGVLADIARHMFLEEHGGGFVFFRPGEASERLYVMADGDVSLVDATGETDASVLLQTGDEFGALSFFTGMRHTATAISQGPCEVWVLRRGDLDSLLGDHPALRNSIAGFLESPRVAAYLQRDQDLDAEESHTARRKAVAALRNGKLPPPIAAKMVRGAPIAIWLGLLLDAIPESLVIGATAGALRVSFIAGIFLSNYPEALASSVGMREQQGIPWRYIGVLWGTAILVTGLGAAVGSVVFQRAPDQAFALVEGLAAGAMLTVITETMMPEALQRSGGFVGLAALTGFLVTTLIGA
jgi:CRP-like cAMP-binding protein